MIYFTQISESLDAWQRFMQLYSQVKIWIKEKNEFLEEPLELGSLPETREKLNNYAVSNNFDYILYWTDILLAI